MLKFYELFLDERRCIMNLILSFIMQKTYLRSLLIKSGKWNFALYIELRNKISSVELGVGRIFHCSFDFIHGKHVLNLTHPFFPVQLEILGTKVTKPFGRTERALDIFIKLIDFTDQKGRRINFMFNSIL